MKVVSLDVWNTLVRSNPDFAIERTRYLADELCISEDMANNIYRHVKDTADNVAEETGGCVSSMNLYKNFLSLLGRDNHYWLKIRQGLEKIFERYPPYVIPETIELLRYTQDQGIVLSIASNTNFIRGTILDSIVLNRLGINWKFQVFSDQIMLTKPNIRFWNIVVRRSRRFVNVKPWEILHIGDNKICDGSCSVVGIKFQIVNSPNDLVKVLMNWVNN